MKIQIKRTVENCFRGCLQRIRSIRFLGAGLLLLALICATMSGIDQLMIDKQEWITTWMAPHLVDNLSFITFLGFIVCYVYSDVPFMNRTELYKILREGRKMWAIEKLGAICLQSFLIVVLVYVMSVLVFIPRVQLSADWGKIIWTMAYSNNIYDYNIYGRSSAVIVNKYEPWQAMLICFFMMWLEITLVGVFMFTISLYLNRIVAIAIVGFMMVLQLITGSIAANAAIAYVLPLYWCRLSIYGERTFLDIYYPSFAYCLIASILGLVICVTAAMLRIRKKEFIWNNEE